MTTYNMTKLLTIVIPCYNVEKYLAECLESILSPEYNDVLEVLAINDGSKDGTLTLVREYEMRFPEILRVIDKPNGGWGTVINMAIGEARGRYFKILDSDDWFDKIALSKYIELLMCSDVDLFVTNYTEIYNDRIVVGENYREDLCYQTMMLDEYFFLTNSSSLFPMTNISVKVDVLKRFSESLPNRYYGDICFYYNVAALSQTVYITNLNLYQYRKDIDEQSTSVNGYIRNYEDYIEVIYRLIGLYVNTPLMINTKKVIRKALMHHLNFMYKLLMSNEYCGNMQESNALLKKFNKFLKQTSFELYWQSAKITNKGVPYVLVWRLFRINLFKLR